MIQKKILELLSILVIGVFIGSIIIPNTNHMNMNKKKADFISLKNDIQKNMRSQEKYKCCLENPCAYCVEDITGCDCMANILNGIHPCGECIGEILEGHGNPYLSKYFATAIAEKTGHLETIKQIIFEKYNISIEDQI